MNPYAFKTLPTAKTKTDNSHAALFAAEVYDDEEEKQPVRGGHSRAKHGTSHLDGESIGEEIAQLRSELRGEARALRSALSRPARVPPELVAEIATLRAAVHELLASPAKRGDAIAAMIRARGIEGAAAAALARLTNKGGGGKSMTLSGGDPTVRLRAAAASIVTTMAWPLALTRRDSDEGQTIIALVGPAGVGKTTTAAKLAARARMMRKTVALVSCDGFRVGAMDQLANYAELMDATFHTASTQIELMDILFSETADVIIVDTSGRAVDPQATEAFLSSSDLREPQRNPRRVDVLLCVPASLRAADAARVHRDFAVAKPTGIVITKIDETETPAGIIHAAFATRLPVSTLCAGQRVPEDIAQANDEAIATHLFPMTTQPPQSAEPSNERAQ